MAPDNTKFREPNPENEPFSILDISLLLRARLVVGLGSALGDRACERSRLLLTTTLPVFEEA